MSEPVKLFFFGDSICFGQCVSPHHSWVYRISHKLSSLQENSERKILVQNPSVNGNTTRQALERMPFDIQSHAPDIIVVQFGINDCNYWATDRGVPRVSPEAFRANLKEIVTRACTFGAQHVFLNTNHPTLRDETPLPHTTITYQQSNEFYNEIIRQVARQGGERTMLIDIDKAFFSCAPDRHHLEKLLQPDGLHLNEAGQDVYVQTVYPPVEKAVLALVHQL